MKLLILTPDAEVFSGEIDSISLPGRDGSFQILKNHAPLVASLAIGKLTYTSGNASTDLKILKGGFVEVLNNEISVLVEATA